MFKEISAKDIKDNLISAIADEWMLISAGNEQGFNMMTASWGFMGEMWGADSVVIAVRPQRYTMEFLDKHDTFALSFYGDNKEIHKVCGSKSGRDVDKVKETGLTPVFDENTVYFGEANKVIICKKQYVSRLTPDKFTDTEPLKWYPNEDYHYMIIGKIIKTLEKK
ncbi:MAG: flavin reductase [Clostridia bacterium]|nr:flavin reductase [Clostridia bacterium]